MAGAKKSRIIPAKPVKGDVRANKHRFKSFNERVATLQINPIQKARQQDEKTTNSFFVARLAHWRDLNLSEPFAKFTKNVTPYSESLVQILHHEQTVIDLLIANLKRSDLLDLEPLLDLTAQLAHDLGHRFEKHYAVVVATVAELVAGHQSVEVLEWSFNTLAWMFQYLSRLLVPDLRATFDILCPLLGKTVKKGHVARFAAEALSFLLRKAALRAERDEKPLRLIISHIFADWRKYQQENQDTELYAYGLMNLFADCINDIKTSRSVRPYGLVVLRSLAAESVAVKSFEVARGVLTNIIHHTSKETFGGAEDVVLSAAKNCDHDTPFEAVSGLLSLLDVMVEVRRGDRVNDWRFVVQAFEHLEGLLSGERPLNADVVSTATRTAVAIVHNSPFDALFSRLDRLMNMTMDPKSPCDFPRFCMFASTINQERFNQLLRPYFFQFLADVWDKCDVRVLFAAQHVASSAQIKSEDIVLTPTQLRNWPEAVLTSVRRFSESDEPVERIDSLLNLANSLPPEAEVSQKLCRAIEGIIQAYLQKQDILDHEKGALLFGRGLNWCLRAAQKTKKRLNFTWGQIFGLKHKYGRLPSYVENLRLALTVEMERDLILEDIQQSLIANLSSESRRLRLATLCLLDALHDETSSPSSKIFEIALQIEQAPLDYRSVRSLTAAVQTLGNLYASAQSPVSSGNAIVHYCFGLLNFKLTPVWADAISVLERIYQSGDSNGPQLIDEIVFRWLEERSVSGNAGESQSSDLNVTKQSINEFQCTNYEKQSFDFSRLSLDMNSAESRLEEEYRQQHHQASEIPSQSPSHALRILKLIPELAEKRSRRLVPRFLAWVVPDEENEATLVGDTSSDGSNQSDRVGLSRQDRLAMLEVFAAIGNPKALYRSQDVYDALLRVLSSGDAATQKVALRAILKWKKEGPKIYSDHFDNLLDNARFREELVLFLPEQVKEKGLSAEQRQEMIQILLPLLFGRVTARGKSSASNMTQLARRKAVFESLGNFPSEELAAFMDIALGPLKLIEIHHNRLIIQDGVGYLDLRKQLGFVKFAKDMLEAVGDKVAVRRDSFLKAILYCLSLNISAKDIAADSDQAAEDQANTHLATQKTIRQVGLQALCNIFNIFPSHSFDDLLDPIYSNIIKPKLSSRFRSENAQSVSGLLKLFSTWATSDELAKHLTHDAAILECLADTIASDAELTPVKNHVKVFIINEILKPIVGVCQSSPDNVKISDELLERFIATAVSILEQEGSRELAESSVSLLLQITPSLLQAHGSRLAEVSCVMLNLPVQQIKPPAKAQILTILQECIPGIASEELLQTIWQTLSRHFTTMKEPWRSQLSNTFLALGIALGGEHNSVASICSEMNAMSQEQLQEPDLEKRSRAFEKTLSNDFGVMDELWAPIVHNCLFFIRDQEEAFVRKNASHLLRSFIEKNHEVTRVDGAAFPSSKVLRGVLHPALRKGASERAELIRVEYVAVMEHLAIHCSQWPEVQDLTSLTVSSEDGESFFGGVVHIQQEWRKRSLIKLARVARQQRLSSESISHFLLPLIEHFVFDRADETDTHSLAAQTITTIGSLCSCLSWVQARKTLRRYTSMIKDIPELEKATIRLVGAVTESVHSVSRDEQPETTLGRSFPATENLVDDITNTLLPPLISFLHHKDENVVSLRVPIAVSATRLICLLPSEDSERRLAPVLTDVCNILRSKAQESRDLSRKTLAEISSLIGPERFSFILKELRIALGRGYQLHVKSYTLHSLLVACDFKPGNLDYCLEDIMAILLDDIFGATGQEKDADGYTNKAKEVKGSKSMDSAERMAAIATVACLKSFLNPVQTLLSERLDLKSVTKIDELLRRIGSGLQQNEAIGSQDTLIFCYQILQQSGLAAQANTYEPEDAVSQRKRQQKERFEVRNGKGRKALQHSQVALQHFKLARFSLDLLRVVLHRHESLRTPASLHGFLTPIGDILLEAQEEVKTAALRLLASIIKVPMTQWKANAPVYADTAFRIVLIDEPSTNTELSQAAIKLVTSVLRDRPEVVLKDSQVTSLVKKIIPDLTQPARQGVTFNYLKAVVLRGIVSNEVYQAMDAIARLFVTYGDANARNQARSIWLQFVLDYEQSEARFKQTLNFLVLNLSYDHAEGRQSVMEAIHFLSGKLDIVHLQQMCGVLCKPLLSKVVSDDNVACRDMAALLIKEVYQKAGEEQFNEIRHHLRFMYEDGDGDKRATSLQAYSLLIEADPDRSSKDVTLLRGWLIDIFSQAKMDSTEWRLVYAGLQLASRLTERYPNTVFSTQFTDLWSETWRLSSFPHAWVKLAAAKLVSTYISEVGGENGEMLSNNAGAKGRSGLQLERSWLVDQAHSYIRTLRRENPPWLIQQVVSNLEVIDRAAGDAELVHEGSSEESSDGMENEGKHLTLRGLYFSKMSQIIRQDKPLITKQGALQLLAKIVERLPASLLEPHILPLLSALNNMTDSTKSKMILGDPLLQEVQQSLSDISHQTLSVLQKKLPDGEFVKAMHLVQQAAKKKREERRRKRAIEAVADPERRARDKMKKREQGRARKKEMNSIHRSRRRGW